MMYFVQKFLKAFSICVGIIVASSPGFAAERYLDDVNISSITVNGGADSVSVGTTCIRVSVPVAASCAGGFIAIRNNNKQLVAAAMQAKAMSNKIWLFYDDSAGPGPYHCPGREYTACSVNDIEIK